MAEALVCCRVLEILHLDHAHLGPEGLAHLSKALTSRPSAFTTLAELTVAGNAAGDFGMASFAEALSRGPTLQGMRRLRMADNGITQHGVMALTQSFQHGGGKRLRYLDLSNNPIGDKGAALLAQAMSPPTTTTTAAASSSCGKKRDSESTEMWAMSMWQSCKRRLVGLLTGTIPPPPSLDRMQSSTSTVPEEHSSQQSSGGGKTGVVDGGGGGGGGASSSGGVGGPIGA